MDDDVLMTGLLRDAATLIADDVKHTLDIPELLRRAAKTIDGLRSSPRSSMFPTAEQHENYQQRHAYSSLSTGDASDGPTASSETTS